MRRAPTGNNSEGGPAEVSASILEGKGPAGLYIEKAAEGKKDRGAGGRERVGYLRTEVTCGEERQIASPQSSRQAHRDRRILQSAQKHG
jgi:hypothetical protein